MPLALLGSFLLAAGWFGLTVCPALLKADGSAVLVTVNTLLASAGGSIAACLTVVLLYGKPDPSMICNGLIAGLVAISGCGPFVGPSAALMIGAIAGVLAVTAILFWERRGIDDPIGVISVHGVCGLWAGIALGLFANGTYGQDYNGVHTATGVKGLFYGDFHQLLCQIIMAASCVTWSFIAGGLTFKLLRLLLGGNRVRRDTEVMGLDIPELGVAAYPEFVSPMPNSIGASYEPRPSYIPTTAGHRRYSVVLEGADPASLIKIWSSLCQVRAEPATPEFKEVYPFVTTVTGNRFRFNGGDPDVVKAKLCQLFHDAMQSRQIIGRIEP
jgi:Amt family ammonium transporter